MIHTTLPTMEQLQGKKAWSIVKRDEAEAYSTDLAILQGADQSAFSGTGAIYITKSACPTTGAVRGLKNDYKEELRSPWCPDAVRLVIPAAEAKKLEGQYRAESKNLLVWGEYPQTALKWGFQPEVRDILPALRRQGKLEKTGKSYTFWRDTRPYRFQQCAEYKYGNGKYVFLPASCSHPKSGAQLKNGGYVAAVEHVVKVEPIRWLRDPKTGDWLSKRLLLSFPMIDGDYDGYFRATPLARYLRKHVDFEILPLADYKKAVQAQKSREAQLQSVFPDREEARRLFATLSRDDQSIMADLLAKGTPERDQTAKRLKALRYQAYDRDIKAKENMDYKTRYAESLERDAQIAEEKGQELLREYQRKAAEIRQEAKREIANAKNRQIRAVRVATKAQACLATYWEKHRIGRGERA